MSKKRTQYSSEFKARVALTAIRRDETIPQLEHVMEYIPHRSIAGNDNSLNKRLGCFPEIPVLAKRTDKPQMIYIVSSGN